MILYRLCSLKFMIKCFEVQALSLIGLFEVQQKYLKKKMMKIMIMIIRNVLMKTVLFQTTIFPWFFEVET